MQPASLFRPPDGYTGSALRILEAAEDCFGEQGIDVVSLRQIAIAAGQANTAAVQYHFGKKTLLMDAIFYHRLPALEQRRLELSQSISPQDLTQPKMLLKLLFLPIWELRNARGRPSYALFLRRLNNIRVTPLGWENAVQAAPITQAAVAGLRRCMADVSEQEQGFRIMLIVTIMLDAFWKADHMRTDAASAARLISTALGMACAAIQRPPSPDSDSWL